MSKKHIRNNEVINRIGAGFRELRKAAGKGQKEVIKETAQSATSKPACQSDALTPSIVCAATTARRWASFSGSWKCNTNIRRI